MVPGRTSRTMPSVLIASSFDMGGEMMQQKNGRCRDSDGQNVLAGWNFRATGQRAPGRSLQFVGDVDFVDPVTGRSGSGAAEAEPLQRVGIGVDKLQSLKAMRGLAGDGDPQNPGAGRV